MAMYKFYIQIDPLFYFFNVFKMKSLLNKIKQINTNDFNHEFKLVDSMATKLASKLASSISFTLLPTTTKS
jgi:hypothetical protein